MELKYSVTNLSKYSNVRQVLKNEFNISNRLITNLKQNKSIYLNDKETYLDKILSIGDVVKCKIDFNESSENIVPTKINLNIIYEDDYFLVVDKPCNMAVHPSILHYDNSLSNGVKYYFDSIGLHRKIRPVNRLDRDTTGIVLFAKNEYIQECLIKQMQTNTFYKEYLAILEGILKEPKGTIDAPIARKEGSIIERCIDKNGSKAVTHYEVLDSKNNLSIVKFVLETGRTHQIRLHSKHIGHPIIGDTLYGTNSNLISRQALHCHKISFIHPITKNKIEFISPVPDDMQKAIN
ncbi:MAG: RluA family pseudouridine synthase [Clostridia bacterium]|nr:RluA family pseudouridine synthase [Clostridia bacterium]